jgi:protein-tyrosine phosphatase
MSDVPSLVTLMAVGLLTPGQQLVGAQPGIEAELSPNGLMYHGQVFDDPTAAMQAALGRTLPEDNGWIFWKVADDRRGFSKPLEHVRVEYLASGQTQSMAPKTSTTHPLRIDTLPVPSVPGRLGLTFCPGKKGDALYGGAWDRDLQLDLARIIDWGAGAVVTILEEHEFALLGVPDFSAVMRQSPLTWIHLQIRDSDVPDDRFHQAWPGARRQLQEILKAGKGVVIHCRGGLGRTGTVAAQLLVEQGVSPGKAIELVRSARPGAIETWEQEQYVRQLPIR